jgi:hypothetical protein
MLIWGTANPIGVQQRGYDGLYLTDSDIDDMVVDMTGKPVKVEHKGNSVGTVVSTWKHDGRMDVLINVDSDNIEAALVNEFVRTGKCSEFSLGYKVTMSASSQGGLVACGKKQVMEVSIVMKGARNNCKIRGFSLT